MSIHDAMKLLRVQKTKGNFVQMYIFKISEKGENE
jgi:hypothetical protein